MANDINRIMLVGRLTREPELRHIPSGTAIASFSLANNRSYTTSAGEKKEDVSFFNCIAWGRLGEIMTEYCKKGKRIGVEGRLQQRSWEDQEGKKRSTVEVVVDNFQFLDASGQSNGTDHQSQSEPDYIPPNSADNPFSSDDVPF